MKNNIKAARENINMTQKECAETLDITLRAWQTYEQGISEPKNEILCKIADMFHVSTDYLLGRNTETADPMDMLSAMYNIRPTERHILEWYLSLDEKKRRELVDTLEKIVKS